MEEARGIVAEAERLAVDAKKISGLPSLLARFIDGAAEAWVIIDKDGRIALFNRKAVFLFGWQPEQVIGEPVEVLLPEALRGRHAHTHRAGYAHDPYIRPMGANVDLLALHRDGSTFPVLIDLHPEMGDDGLYVRAAIRRKDSSTTEAPLSGRVCSWVPPSPNPED